MQGIFKLSYVELFIFRLGAISDNCHEFHRQDQHQERVQETVMVDQGSHEDQNGMVAVTCMTTSFMCI